MNPIICPGINPYLNNPNAKELSQEANFLYEGKKYTKINYETTSTVRTDLSAMTRLLKIVYVVGLTILTCFIALAFQQLRNTWSDAINGFEETKSLENITVLIAEKASSGTKSLSSSQSSAKASSASAPTKSLHSSAKTSSESDKIKSLSASHSSSTASSLFSDSSSTTSSSSSDGSESFGEVTSTLSESTHEAIPDFTAEMNVLAQQRIGYVGEKYTLATELGSVRTVPNYWEKMSWENEEPFFDLSNKVWEFKIPKENLSNMPEGFPDVVLLPSKFIPDEDGKDFQLKYKNEIVTLNVDWFTESYGWISKYPEYWQKMTRKDGSAFTIDPSDYYVEVQLHGDIKWSPKIEGLPEGLPHQISLPSKWLKGVKEGDTFKIRYDNKLLALKANQNIPGRGDYKDDKFENKVRAVGENFFKTGQGALDESSNFVLKSDREENDIYFYTLKNGGVLFTLSPGDKTLQRPEKQELKIFEKIKDVEISSRIATTSTPSHLRFNIEAPYLIEENVQDFEIVINKRFLMIAKHKGNAEKNESNKNYIEFYNEREYVNFIPWSRSEELKDLSLESVIQLLQNAEINLSGGLLKITFRNEQMSQHGKKHRPKVDNIVV